jgi:hypothetical protein
LPRPHSCCTIVKPAKAGRSLQAIRGSSLLNFCVTFPSIEKLAI